MGENISGENIEVECLPKPDAEICQNFVDKIRHEFSKLTKKEELPKVVQKPIKDIKKEEEESDSDVCIIEEGQRNTSTTLLNNNDITFYDDDVTILDSNEAQLIVPKKTDDITKIKGWRRKQFFVEKPTTVEFEEFIYRKCYNKTSGKIGIEEKVRNISPDNVENAFVCSSLDEFLEQEAELKVNYEVPHLYAEMGIKLTKEELASTPSLSETDIKKIEMKYCKPVPFQTDVIDLEDITTEKIKKIKRPFEEGEEEQETFKVIKLEDNNLRLVRIVKKPIDKQTNCNNKGTVEQNSQGKILKGMKLDIKDNFKPNVGEMKLTSKVLGLVVYPSPHKPLHPMVQFHLRKLRSYRTKIDENWANFAASALVKKDSMYKRFILPVKCCVKEVEEFKSVEENNINALVAPENSEKPTAYKSSPLCPVKAKISKEDFGRMKNCKVVIEKLDVGQSNKNLCVKHIRYSCQECGMFKKSKSILKLMSVKNTDLCITAKPREQVIRPSPIFDEEITMLLSKKLKVFNPDSLTSIDSLKTLNRDAVELIKLSFIQKSFQHGYVSIWYLKPEKTDVRSRAFLTFSKTPPVPNAINLRCGLIVNSLPKVIRDIVHPEKSIDPDEYVLLFCNGTYWEIHGSVNVAFNKATKSTEQITIPAALPELKKLQNLSFQMLDMKAVKWWVLDMTQKFKVIELKSEDLISIVSRNKLLEFLKYGTYGFLPMRTNLKKRVFGTYMIQTLLPYVLIGPYYIFEIPNVSLRGEFSTLPFEYNEAENAKESGELKRHISLTIKESKETGKTVEGLWLHYKAFSEHLCFLEVLTKSGVNISPRSTYNIQEEHGYSLNSNALPTVDQSSDEHSEINLQNEVYLYFDIFSLGYVMGLLEKDNSVTIRHPFNEQTKVNSAEIGNWFLGVVKRRIQFVPKNLVVNWFVTKRKSHLKNRQPFNKNFLNGAHILTNAGIFYIVKLGESNNPVKILDKDNVLEGLPKNSVIDEVVHLKSLSDLLVKESNTKLNLHRILTLALNEIIILQEELNLFQRLKESLEEEKLRLITSYLIGIHLTGLQKHLKVALLYKVEKLFLNKRGEIQESYLSKLKLYAFGREYLKNLKTIRNGKFTEFYSTVVSKNLDSLVSINSHFLSNKRKKFICFPVSKEIPITPEITEIDSSFIEHSTREEKSTVNTNEPNLIETKSKKQQEERVSSVELAPSSDVDGKVKNSEKSETFVTLTSGKLPSNVKVSVGLRDDKKLEKCRSLQEKYEGVFETTIKPISALPETKNETFADGSFKKPKKQMSPNKKVNTTNNDIVSIFEKNDVKRLKPWKSNDKILFLTPQILFHKTHSGNERSEQQV